MSEELRQALVSTVLSCRAEILAEWNTHAATCFEDGGRAAETLFEQLVLHLKDPRAPDMAPLERYVVRCLQAGKDLAVTLEELSCMREAVANSLLPRASDEVAAHWIREVHRALDGWIAYGADRYYRVRLRVLMALDKVVTSSEHATSTDELLQRLLEVCASEIGAVDVAAIVLFEGDTVRAHASHGFTDEIRDALRFDATTGFTSRVLREGAPLELTGAELRSVIPPILRQAGLKTLYAVPIADGHVHGAFGVAFMASRSGESFPEEATGIFRMLAHKTSALLQQALLLNRFERAQALVDSFLDNSPAIVFLKDLEHRYLLVNRRMEELVVAQGGEANVLGKTTREVFATEVAGVLDRNDERVIADGRVVEVEEVFREEGAERNFLLTKFPIRDRRGEIVALGGIASDVTVRKRKENQQALLAAMGEILVRETDLAALAVRIADCLVRDLVDLCIIETLAPDGTARRLVVRGEDPVLVRVLSQEPHRGLDHPLAAALVTGKTQIREEVPPEWIARISQNAEEAKAWTEARLTSVAEVPLTARGHRVGAMLLATRGQTTRFRAFDLSFVADLGARIALTVDNALLYAAAAVAVADRDEVAGIVAHDLRGPLNVIVSALELLLRHEHPDAQEPKLKVALRSANRMARLIEDLLDMTRMEGGKLVVRREPVSLGEVLRELTESHASAFTKDGRRLLLELADERLEVLGDRDRLAQVVENLLGNALKFTPPGGTVTVGASVDGAHARVFVRDTGVGIPQENLRTVFTRFWQGARGDRRGAGLGLAIADGLVRAHGGRIWAESDPGKGTTVTFLIPLHEADAVRGEPTTQTIDDGVPPRDHPASLR